MAFIGSINAETRKWLGNNGQAFEGRKVYVGCSGAFTVEQIISRYAPKARLWGNDVSLYSSVLGAYLAGQSFRLEVQDEKFAWVEPHLTDEEAKAAAVMVLFEVLKYEKANNLFKQRHWAHYLNNFQKFHQATVAKIRERKQEIRLEAYTSQDVYDLLDGIPPDAVAVAFLPTYAGGYERMFKRLGEIFAWDRPAYGMIDADRKVAILEKMKARDYLFLDDKVWEDLPQVAVVRKARMKPVYVYSNLAALRLGVMKQQRHADFVPFARLSDADEITPESKVTVTPTTNRVVNYYRDVYHSVKGDIEAVCQGCTEDCLINLGSVLLEKYGIKPYISVEMDQERLFKKLKQEHPSIGALGIACIPELAMGMRLCLRSGIPPVGIPLNANRCARWMSQAHETSFNLEQLEELLD